MRKIDRSSKPIPPALLDQPCTDHLILINGNPSTIEAKSDFYKGKVVGADRSVTYTVTKALKELYINKCAYCEKRCFKPEVEHFRPRGRVIGDNPLPQGYYWLSYEWSNLLPSCHECNYVGAKGDKFPIRGTRVSTFPTSGLPAVFDPTQNVYGHHFLTSERPLYIHPEYCDDFWEHFDFDLDGNMIGKSIEGLITVKDLKLSDEDRSGWRKEIYENYYKNLAKLLRRRFRSAKPITDVAFTSGLEDIVSDLVEESEDETLPYTLFRKALVKKIDFYFIEPFETEFHPILRSKISTALGVISGI